MTRHHRGVLGIAGALAAGAIGAGATWALSDEPPREGPSAASIDPAAAARTSFPGLKHATGEPTLAGLRTAAPAPGEVQQVAGPFDDRFRLAHLALDGTRVTGSVDITSDVSDLLELEVLAGFYDRQGVLLGTGRFVHHLVEDGPQHAGPPSESMDFAIGVPARLRDRAVAAAVGVPVLVNE